MRKITAILLCLVIICGVLASCAHNDDAGNGHAPRVVCTFDVLSNLTNEIVKDSHDSLDVTYLVKSGQDIHNYMPSARDMKDLLLSDLIVYIGGESDKWIEDAVKNMCRKDIKTVRLLDYVEGAHCDSCLDGHDHHHDEVPDEHIWLSFENTQACAKAITEALCEIDGESAQVYQANLATYSVAVNALYDEYKSAVVNAKHKTLVFADRFPFVYLMNELGLEYYAAFPGCSSETTASFETVITLAKKIDELSLPCVLVIEDSNDGIAETVVENTVAKTARILELDSMQVRQNGEENIFLDVMRQNLEILKIALGCE